MAKKKKIINSKAKALMAEWKKKCRFVTSEFRTSYLHVFKPQGFKGAEEKYSLVMLVKKKTNLKEYQRAMKYAKMVMFGADESDWPDNIESPIQDGDSKKNRTKEGYKGHWAIKASTSKDQKPTVVGMKKDADGNVMPIADPAEFVSGDYARAQVFARVWEFPEGSGNYGVQFILDHVQKTKDGKHFGGKKAATEVFNPITADVEDDEDEEEDEDETDDNEDSDAEDGDEDESDDDSDDDDDDDDDEVSFK